MRRGFEVIEDKICLIDGFGKICWDLLTLKLHNTFKMEVYSPIRRTARRSAINLDDQPILEHLSTSPSMKKLNKSRNGVQV